MQGGDTTKPCHTTVENVRRLIDSWMQLPYQWENGVKAQEAFSVKIGLIYRLNTFGQVDVNYQNKIKQTLIANSCNLEVSK